MRDIKDIKFRAKPMSKRPSYPKWAFGLIQSTTKDGTGFLRDVNKNCIHIKANTIGQFTGLYDKNEIEIYEGDIVKAYGREFYSIETGARSNLLYLYTGEIVWDSNECGFSIKGAEPTFIGYYDELEVIGNIYDNPNLLEDKSLPITYN